MGIDALNSGQRIITNNPYEIQEKKYNEELTSKIEDKVAQQQQKADKLELSEEAKKLGPISSKINSGFYDSPEVIRDVAAKISRDIPPGSTFE